MMLELKKIHYFTSYRWWVANPTSLPLVVGCKSPFTLNMTVFSAPRPYLLYSSRSSERQPARVPAEQADPVWSPHCELAQTGWNNSCYTFDNSHWSGSHVSLLVSFYHGPSLDVPSHPIRCTAVHSLFPSQNLGRRLLTLTFLFLQITTS